MDRIPLRHSEKTLVNLGKQGQELVKAVNTCRKHCIVSEFESQYAFCTRLRHQKFFVIRMAIVRKKEEVSKLLDAL